MCVCNTSTFIQHCNPICSRLKLIKLFVLSACVTRCTNLLDNQQRHDNSLSYREPVWNQQLPLSDRTSTSNESSICWLHTLKGADNSKLCITSDCSPVGRDFVCHSHTPNTYGSPASAGLYFDKSLKQDRLNFFFFCSSDWLARVKDVVSGFEHQHLALIKLPSVTLCRQRWGKGGGKANPS